MPSSKFTIDLFFHLSNHTTHLTCIIGNIMRELINNEILAISGGSDFSAHIVSFFTNTTCGCTVGLGFAFFLPNDPINVIIGTGLIFAIFGGMMQP